MKRPSRIHHYVPQFYLRGFTESGSKKAKLQVFDLKERTSFETLPRNVAAKRDWNTIDMDGGPSEKIEQALAGLEGAASRVVQAIRKTASVPDGDDFIVLINFLAILAVRNPRFRGELDSFHADIAQKIADLTLASKERWESTIASMKRDGIEIDDSITYEDMKRFNDEGNYTIKTSQDWLMSLEFHGLDTVIQTMADRHWSTYSTTDNSGSFITGDHPICLSWYGEARHKMPVGPGFGMRWSELYFPIARDLALVGTFEGPSRRVTADKTLVAAANSQIAAFSQRQIYAPSKRFHLTSPEGTICESSKIFRHFRKDA